jgi:uncharacterized protein YjiS (DUF1127 family)
MSLLAPPPDGSANLQRALRNSLRDLRESTAPPAPCLFASARSECEPVHTGRAAAAVPSASQPDVEHFLARPYTFIRCEETPAGDAVMSITYGAIGLRRSATTRRYVSHIFRQYWRALLQWRRRERLRAEMCNLSDRELMDIGTTRGEIDYIAAHPGIDPRRG